MKSKRIILLSVLLLAVAVSVFIVNRHHNACLTCINLKVFSPENIRHAIQGFGSWSVIVYVVLYTANTFSPFLPPIGLMSLAAGAVFGPVLGTIALTAGTFCGTSAAFFAARYLGRSRVEKNIRGKSRTVYNKLSENGFFILLPMRLVGFPPYGIIDLICGVSHMKYRDFVLATMIGASPWIIVQVLLADRFSGFNPKDPVLWGLIIAFVLMVVITGKVVKHKEAAS